MIEVYSDVFPLAIVMALEECSVPHKISSLKKCFPPAPSFATYAAVDCAPLGTQESVSLVGLCRILDYISEKYQILMPDHPRDMGETKQWLYWYSSYIEVNPQEKETAELFDLLNTQLGKKMFITRSYSIADILFYEVYRNLKTSLEKRERLKEWANTIEKRPASVRALEQWHTVGSSLFS